MESQNTLNQEKYDESVNENHKYWDKTLEMFNQGVTDLERVNRYLNSKLIKLDYIENKLSDVESRLQLIESYLRNLTEERLREQELKKTNDY